MPIAPPNSPTPPEARTAVIPGWHFAALAVATMVVFAQFMRPPGFGDDLTYWSFAFNLHEHGLEAWARDSFHDLRWPVWGLCWVLQSLLGINLASYYGPAFLILAAGATVAFVFTHRIARSRTLAWAAGVAFLFHPLLDTVCYRPMPDAAEGVWSGLILLAWWAMMEARSRQSAALFAALAGLGIFIVQANRITGVFVVPVLLAATLLLYPRKFGWLVLAGVCAAFFYALECCFYHDLFGDWLHSLHANSGARGRLGTEAVPLWSLPLRFLDTLWVGFGSMYCLLAVIGAWFGWRKFGTGGRLMVVWFVVLYLEYSCAPQSLFPYRPLVRDADRFLGGLAIPMSVLAGFGLAALLRPALLARWKPTHWLAQHPVYPGLVAFVLLSMHSARPRFTLDFVPDIRRYMATLPTGTKIFTHDTMRPLAFLLGAQDARRFVFVTRSSILLHDPAHEAAVAGCDEVWYARKLLWLNARKKAENRSTEAQPLLASFLDRPEREWTMTRLIAKGSTPDLIFYRRRQPESPPARVLAADAPEWQGLLPTFPVVWTAKTGRSTYKARWRVPENLQGRFGRFEIEGSADEVEAVMIRLRFDSSTGKGRKREFKLKPYLYPGGGKDFFALELPEGCDNCEVEFQFAKGARHATFTGFRAIIENKQAEK